MAFALFGKDHRFQPGDDLQGIYQFQNDSEGVLYDGTGNDCRVAALESLSSLF